MPLKDPDARKAYDRERQRQRVAKGLCINCAKVRIIPPQQACEACRTKQRSAHRKLSATYLLGDEDEEIVDYVESYDSNGVVSRTRVNFYGLDAATRAGGRSRRDGGSPISLCRNRIEHESKIKSAASRGRDCLLSVCSLDHWAANIEHPRLTVQQLRTVC